MKRYERMTKEEIIDFVCLGNWTCDRCGVKKEYCDRSESGKCNEIVRNWLNDEVTIKKVPRFILIKTQEDLERAFQEFDYHCRKIKCTDCKYSNYSNGMATTTNWHSCYQRYLAEEVEVEE